MPGELTGMSQRVSISLCLYSSLDPTLSPSSSQHSLKSQRSHWLFSALFGNPIIQAFDSCSPLAWSYSSIASSAVLHTTVRPPTPPEHRLTDHRDKQKPATIAAIMENSSNSPGANAPQGVASDILNDGTGWPEHDRPEEGTY